MQTLQWKYINKEKYIIKSLQSHTSPRLKPKNLYSYNYNLVLILKTT